MKGSIYLVIAFLINSCLGQEIPDRSDSITTPIGFEIIADIEGDLDKDGVAEIVLVFNTRIPSDDEEETWQEGNAISREIHVYKKKSNTWNLWHMSKSAIMDNESDYGPGDPFQNISIQNGCIVIEHFMGNRVYRSYLLRFRYLKGSFQLIGATISRSEFCGFIEDLDYNLSTGKAKYKKREAYCRDRDEDHIPNDEEKELTQKLNVLPNMDGFNPESSWSLIEIPN